MICGDKLLESNASHPNVYIIVDFDTPAPPNSHKTLYLEDRSNSLLLQHDFNNVVPSNPTISNTRIEDGSPANYFFDYSSRNNTI